MKSNFIVLLKDLEKIQGLQIRAVSCGSYGCHAVSFTYNNKSFSISGGDYEARGFLDPYCWQLFAGSQQIAKFNAFTSQEPAIFGEFIKILKVQI